MSSNQASNMTAFQRPTPMDFSALEVLTRQIRYTLVEVSHKTKTPHLASCLSAVDVLSVLYGRHLAWRASQATHPQRDRFLLSKGHAASLLYTVLAYFDAFPIDALFTHGQTDSAFEEHPGVHAPAGVESVSGSLGHNLGIALGMAQAAKLKRQPQQHIVLMGDGELNEGSIWEAAMLAPARQLDNLTAIVDINRWQGTGRSQEITALEPLADKWRSFGWHVARVDGHDLSAIDAAFTRLREVTTQPKVLLADTVKGQGITFMEDDNNWHYRIPTAEEVQQAKQELGL